MNTGNMNSVESADDFIPVEKDEGGDKVQEVQHIDGGEEPYSLFHKPEEQQPVPTHVSEGMQQMQKDAQQLQQEQQSVPVHLSENVQEVKVETEESDYKKVNSEIIEILKNEPKFEGAFQDVTFSNGEKALVYNRGMFAFSKNELPSNLGISEKYSTPKNIREVQQEKHSAIMFTNEGMIFLVTGGVYNRNAQEYEAIYRMVMSKKESSGNTEEFQTTFSNKELFPNQGFSDEGAELDAEGNVVSRAVDANFYWAMYMKDNLNDKKYGFDTKALLKEFAEASVLTKEEEEKNRQTSPEELKAMIAEIN